MLRFLEYRPGISGGIKEYLERVFRDTRRDVLINYGNSNVRGWGGNTGQPIVWLNRPEAIAVAVDKPGALLRLREAKVSVPRVYMRPSDIALPEHAAVVVKRRHHHGGRHIRLADPWRVRFDGDHYAEEFVRAVREFRVFVVGGRTCVREKLGGRGEIRSRAKGWTFVYVSNVPDAVRKVAVQAVRALGLDFGGVDVGSDRLEERVDQVATVYEVNTAPRLEAPSTLNWWREALELLVRRKIGGE